MNTLLRAAAAVAALALTTPALAQQAATRSDGRFGLGVGITSGDTSPGLGYLLFVPLNVAPQLRIEPFLGWHRSDTDAGGKDSDVVLGVGAFFVQPVATQLQLYAGGRLASNWLSHRDARFAAPGSEKWESRNTLLGLAAGGEYLPIPRVALGAEFQVAYVSVGDRKTTQANGTVTEGGGGSASATQGTLFVRIYLF